MRDIHKKVQQRLRTPLSLDPNPAGVPSKVPHIISFLFLIQLQSIRLNRLTRSCDSPLNSPSEPLPQQSRISQVSNQQQWRRSRAHRTRRSSRRCLARIQSRRASSRMRHLPRLEAPNSKQPLSILPV